MAHVREIMTANPTTVSMDTPVEEAARLMRDRDIGLLAVMENDHVAGVITDRDLTTEALAHGKENARVSEIMTRSPVRVSPDDSDSRVEQLMSEHGVRRLLVCEGDKLLGVVSVGDIAVRAGEQPAGEVMEQTGPTDR